MILVLLQYSVGLSIWRQSQEIKNVSNVKMNVLINDANVLLSSCIRTVILRTEHWQHLARHQDSLTSVPREGCPQYYSSNILNFKI